MVRKVDIIKCSSSIFSMIFAKDEIISLLACGCADCWRITLMRYENATVQLVGSFHEIHMTAINIQLPKLLSNHLSTR